MANKNAKASVKEMSHVKDDLLQQALQQVKVLKAKLESSDQAESSQLQQALEQVEDLSTRLNLAEQANRKLQQTLQQVDGLKAKLEADAQSNNSRLRQALQQVERLKLEVQSLKDEHTEQAPTMTSGAPCTPVQLSIDLSNPDSSNKSNADSIPPLTERASSSNPSNSFISNLLTPQEKVALFAALFAWRRDAYAIRWENSSTGAHGYKPARDHDYSTHKYSPKEKRKPCPGPPECPDFTLINEALKHHLQGKETIGVYPMLEGDTCMFLAIDLDQKNQNRIAKCSKTTQPWSGHAPAPKRELNNDQDQSFSVSTCNSWSWQDDAQSLMHAAGSMNVPAYLERSRSGKGGHLWIFFASPVLAAMARRLGEAMITKAIHDTGQLHLRSYDRMFPNQDNAPQKGYGNLIALPLQKGPLAHGNSAFLDETMTPYPDQWDFLSSVKKMETQKLEALVREASRQNALISVARPSENEEHDKADPWVLTPSRPRKEDTLLMPPLPASITVTLCNFAYIPKNGLMRNQLNRIETIAAFQNPEFYRNQSLRISNYKTPRIISCAEEFPEHLALPRGCLDALTDLFNKSGVQYEIDDKRFAGRKIRAKFKGKLREAQKKAAQDLLLSENGVLSAVPGFGKTVLAAYCISKRNVNTLVLVHRQQLLRQWKEQLASFLELPPASIGQIGAGKRNPTGIIDVATVKSLYKNGVVDDLVAQYGQIIVDECHGVGAVDFEQILRQVKAKYVLGLTATPVRYDGHHPIIVMQCGPIRHRVRHGDVDTGIAEHIVVPRVTMAELPEFAKHYSTQEIITDLVSNESRNKMIVDDVLEAVAAKRTPLVLTNRKDHLQLLRRKLEGKVKNIIVFQGGLGLKKLSAITKQLESVPQNEERVVLAIGQCIGEGFDDSRLDTLFLAMPISFSGRLEQYAGRIHRAHAGKTVVKIYDYVDAHIEKMYRMFKKRQVGYKKIGYKIESLVQSNS